MAAVGLAHPILQDADARAITPCVSEPLLGLRRHGHRRVGRFWLIIGALQLITGWLFYQRTTVGQTHGLVWTFIRALPYAGLTQ